MSSAEQRTHDLGVALQEAIAILRRHTVESWASQLEAVLPLIERRDAIGLERLLGMYGGMGSINDILIMQVNGHRITEGEEKVVNETLRSYLSRVHELARDLLREVR